MDVPIKQPESGLQFHLLRSIMLLPCISISTPTFNRQASLQRAIESVRRQSVQDDEHIIVDDCSTDETQALVASYQDSRICYTRFSRCRGAK